MQISHPNSTPLPSLTGSFTERGKMNSSGKPMLYRYEYDGIVIYDAKARVAGQQKVEVRRRSMSTNSTDVVTGGPLMDQMLYSRMKRYPPLPNYDAEYTIEVPTAPHILTFDSRFESGNLRKAIVLKEGEYNLLLENDTGTKGSTQWFYFKARSPLATEVKFNIINLCKPESLYQNGLSPLVWSEHLYRTQRIGWYAGGKDVQYFVNGYPKQHIDKEGNVYEEGFCATLSFSYEFLAADDTVFFAQSYPYTVTDLNDFLDSIKGRRGDVVRVNPLCRTIAGNICNFMTITEDVESYLSCENEQYSWQLSAGNRRKLIYKERMSRKGKDKHFGKKVVVITSRVHPGETVASYIIEGLIDFLTSDHKDAQSLRSNFIFRIVPMLNPDGVRYGNYRCSLLGVDLNRRWIRPHKQMHSPIYYTKKMIQVLKERHEIALYCDIHGHSRKRGAFMYGNNIKPQDRDDNRKNLLSRLVPYLMSQKCDIFSLDSCSFKMEKAKEATARIVMYKLGITNSYTLETGLLPTDNNQVLTEGMLRDIGKSLAQSCLSLASSEQITRRIQQYSRKFTKKKSDRADELSEQEEPNDILDMPIAEDIQTPNAPLPEVVQTAPPQVERTIKPQQKNTGILFNPRRNRTRSPPAAAKNIINFQLKEDVTYQQPIHKAPRFVEIVKLVSPGLTNLKSSKRNYYNKSAKFLGIEGKLPGYSGQNQTPTRINESSFEQSITIQSGQFTTLTRKQKTYWSREHLKRLPQRPRQVIDELVNYWGNLQQFQQKQSCLRQLTVFGENPGKRLTERLPSIPRTRITVDVRKKEEV